jgi:2-octaprenylphenol hydroxylase
MTGACLACALADTPLRVAVVEAGELPGEATLEQRDLRVSALTRASERILEHVGAWPYIAQHRLSAFRDMHVWDAGGSGEIHFSSADIGEPTLGYIVENRLIQAALINRLQDVGNVQMFSPVSIASCDWTDEGVTVALDDGRRLTAGLLVGADGARSRVREQAGIPVRGWSYEQTAVVVNVRTEKGHQETAWQRFLPTGPLAYLPLTDNMSAIVWSTSPQQADTLLAMDDEDFRTALGEAFEYRLGKVIESGPRAAFPLRLQHAEAYVRPGLALIGDAAHSIHPLAGQGVNLGLLDVAALAEILLQGASKGRQPGDYEWLRRYERWRKADNLGTMFVMDAFKRVFGNSLPPVKWLRNLGLQITDHSGPIKQKLVRQAMGLEGDLPPLARAS